MPEVERRLAAGELGECRLAIGVVPFMISIQVKGGCSGHAHGIPTRPIGRAAPTLRPAPGYNGKRIHPVRRCVPSAGCVRGIDR